MIDALRGRKTFVILLCGVLAATYAYADGQVDAVGAIGFGLAAAAVAAQKAGDLRVEGILRAGVPLRSVDLSSMFSPRLVVDELHVCAACKRAAAANFELPPEIGRDIERDGPRYEWRCGDHLPTPLEQPSAPDLRCGACDRPWLTNRSRYGAEVARLDACPGCAPHLFKPSWGLPKTASIGEVRKTVSEMESAIAKGYEGKACGECSAYTLVRIGAMLKCVSCGDVKEREA